MFNFDISVKMSIKDSQGNDLLNPNNENSFRSKDIKLFYVTNNKIEEVYNSNYDNPRNFRIYKDKDRSEYRISVFLDNYDEKEQYSIAYIQWNSNDTDTIQSEFKRYEGSLKCTKVWFNGKKKWDMSLWDMSSKEATDGGDILRL